MQFEVEGLSAGYGRMDAVRNVTFGVGQGALVTLLGHNGAGKTTVLKAAAGLIPVRGGQIRFAGKPVTTLPTASRMDLGMRLLPEGRGIFPALTVQENIDVVERAASHDADALFRHAELFDYFPILKEKRAQVAGQMSGGQQQMLAVGLALIGRPRSLLLDEPSIGLAPKVVEDIFTRVKAICAEHALSVLLVEQNVSAALNVADSVVILNNGAIVFSGDVDDARRSDFWKFF